MGKTQEALVRAENKFEAHAKRDLRNGGKLTQTFSAPDGSEHFQRLRANLVARYPDRAIKTIVFCGTAHHHGSTTMATHFAVTLARDYGLKVLLVDVNLRTPALHDIFGVVHAPGFSDLIRHEKDSVFSIVQSHQPNLYILPSGSSCSGPARLFETNRFDQFLRKARKQFDYVILDAPPLPTFSESRLICPKIDGVVLVVEAGRTRRQVILAARKEIEEAGGTVLGIVINKRRYPIPEWIYKRL